MYRIYWILYRDRTVTYTVLAIAQALFSHHQPNIKQQHYNIHTAIISFCFTAIFGRGSSRICSRQILLVHFHGRQSLDSFKSRSPYWLTNNKEKKQKKNTKHFSCYFSSISKKEKKKTSPNVMKNDDWYTVIKSPHDGDHPLVFDKRKNGSTRPITK